MISQKGVNLATPKITPTIWAEPNGEPQQLIVACLIWGDKYGDEYVLKLQNAVAKHLSIPHSFVCFSDRMIPNVYCVPLFKAWEGWWQKVGFFRPEILPKGSKILYLDLDVVITKSLDELALMDSDCPLTMIYNFGPNRPQAAHNSSVMTWTAGDPRVEQIYNLFSEDVMKYLHGDQCWIWRVLRDQIADWPVELVSSYKYDMRGKGDPLTTPIVVFHGDPKPHQCSEPWVRQHWHDL